MTRRLVGPPLAPEILARINADLDADELLHSLTPPTCELKLRSRDYELCGDPAHWYMAIPCGHGIYLCNPHNLRLQAILAAGTAARCFECNTVCRTDEITSTPL